MKTLLFLMLMLTILACSKIKEWHHSPASMRDGWANHVYYDDSAGFPNGEYRRYLVEWTADTTCGPSNPQCGRVEVKRIKQSLYNILIPPSRLGDTAFIPLWPR